MSERIYMSSPDVGALEEEYLLDAIRSGWIAPLGPAVDAFEGEFADRIGVSNAVALSSGTAALHLGLLGLGVGEGDIVVVSTLTFAATAFAVSYVGAIPYFIDCDRESGNMDPDLLRSALEKLRDSGEQASAIIPVDLLGKTVDYTRICAIAAEFDVPVLADAAEAAGATHHGQQAGSFGSASVLSFNGNKIMTTSGGGMLLTNDEELASHVRYLATQARQPTVHYEHTEIGYNYRMSNLLAALGRAQLRRLDDMIEKRREMRKRYREFFAVIPGVEIFGGVDDAEDNCWLTSIVVDSETAGWAPEELREHLQAENIESRPLWKPMHLQTVFEGARAELNGNAERLFTTGITLPSGSALTPQQSETVTSSILTFLGSRS